MVRRAKPVTAAEVALVGDLTQSLRTVSLGLGIQALAPVLDVIGGALTATESVLYRPEFDAGRYNFKWFVDPKASPAFEKVCTEGLVAAGPDTRFGYYDPLRPEPAQRNRVRTLHEMRVGTAQVESPMLTALRKGGYGDKDQLRVLLCDGENLLAWVGFLREEPFCASDKALLRMLAPDLLRRVRLEYEVSRTSLLAAGFESALEALGRPAYLVDGRGRIVHANAMGLDSRESLSRLRKRARDDDASYERFAVRGAGTKDYQLLVLRAHAPERGARLLAFSEQWGFTPKQRQVFSLVIDGKTNKEIATELRCAPGTVELHVTGLLRRTRTGHRAALMAKFWSVR